MKRFLHFTIFAVLTIGLAQAQTVMIIPFSKKGEDKQLIVEDNKNCYRFIETSLKKKFLEKGLSLIDYRMAIERLDQTVVLAKRSQRDIMSILVQKAKPDIYIISEIERFTRSENSQKPEHKLVMNLTSHQTNNASTLAAEILDSGWRYYEECNSLTTKIMMCQGTEDEPLINDFASSLLEGRKDRTFTLEFFVADESEYNYFTMLSDGELLLQKIMMWIKTHSSDKAPNSNVSDKYLIFRSLHIQLDESVGAASPGLIASSLMTYLNGLGVKDTVDEKLSFGVTTPGDNIIFTLQ